MILLNELSGDVVTRNLQISGSIIEQTAKLEGNIINNGAKRFPDYHGEYIFTPNSETQVIETAEETLHQNIIINPIPSNYGLIGWNGSYLTVS